MKLWKLEPTDAGSQFINYDCSDGFVIRAECEQDAREMAEKAGHNERDDAKRAGYVGFWIAMKLVDCRELNIEGEPGIVLESFLAG